MEHKNLTSFSADGCEGTLNLPSGDIEAFSHMNNWNRPKMTNMSNKTNFPGLQHYFLAKIKWKNCSLKKLLIKMNVLYSKDLSL